MRPPEGSVELTPDEAVEAIVTGDHPETASGGIVMDAALITLIRAGEIKVCRFPDGRLAFAKVVL